MRLDKSSDQSEFKRHRFEGQRLTRTSFLFPACFSFHCEKLFGPDKTTQTERRQTAKRSV